MNERLNDSLDADPEIEEAWAAEESVVRQRSRVIQAIRAWRDALSNASLDR